MQTTYPNLEQVNILAIESSCDETGVAIYNGAKGLVANQLFSQVDLHALYGGVVPELASRDHVKRVQPLVDAALAQAGIGLEDLSAVAYTSGPGLIGALLVGSTYAKTLALGLNIPALAINHLEGHLLAPFLEEEKPEFPLLGVLISGGHSQFVYARSYHDYQVLGQSVDDAVGEAFDKTAKLLGLPYPGGRLLSELAQKGNPDFSFAAPMINRPGVDLSFSGLKTAALNKILELQAQRPDGQLSEQDKADVARAFENTVVRTFLIKIKRCVEQIHKEHGFWIKNILMVGGVSANRTLRAELSQEFNRKGVKLFYARPSFCVDNGAMIAIAGFAKYIRSFGVQQETKPTYAQGEKFNLGDIRSRWSLEELKDEPSATNA
ncbi:tRNA (adenosine(37)-N6)-threonylcarbamoyltransferase complex transferase subunit TsaD [Psittacicella melopsittaci]|uniref:tRNA N6-adenosine threonylcarbamoyltransferase n=1 Tax=Psittacicella melopsittaci TaxID=2028576 RepID=A0A3A1YA08_9GAMM|nr:tRNA (adenosine(37)-N6)-threonylcarbamoyltransferase complex transferase subunit TsaD [Psittacicella melopsittaci]RIY34028.1 tRNA (adenosine(37)-N6)-threonylcarbamoyltransferase complex transferase subunit TsaD [Psittacicella melopsittaci]